MRKIVLRQAQKGPIAIQEHKMSPERMEQLQNAHPDLGMVFTEATEVGKDKYANGVAILWHTYKHGQSSWGREYWGGRILAVGFIGNEGVTAYMSVYVPPSDIETVKEAEKAIAEIEKAIGKVEREATLYVGGDFNYQEGNKRVGTYREEIETIMAYYGLRSALRWESDTNKQIAPARKE